MAAKTSKKSVGKTDIEIKSIQGDGATIPGAAPFVVVAGVADDIDALLLGAGATAVESSSSKSSATPTITATSIYVKHFLDGSKAEKDGKAKKERYADLLRGEANKKRIKLAREKGQFLSAVKIVAEGTVETDKLAHDGSVEHGPDGKPVKVQVAVEGSITCSVSSAYGDITPDETLTAQDLMAKFKAILGGEAEYKRCIKSERTFAAKPELLSDPKNLAKVLACLKGAGVLDLFEVGYAFTPTVAFHEEATMSEEAEKKMKLLVDAKLAKPKAASLSGK